MMYDHETRILYTGDLFGGLSYQPDLYAGENYWEGMKAFHQIYMPTQEAISLAIKNIRALDPQPLVIAPQHGSLITGEWIEHYLKKLGMLPVGLNLLIESQNKENYIAAMNEMLLELSGLIVRSTSRGVPVSGIISLATVIAAGAEMREATSRWPSTPSTTPPSTLA